MPDRQSGRSAEEIVAEYRAEIVRLNRWIADAAERRGMLVLLDELGRREQTSAGTAAMRLCDDLRRSPLILGHLVPVFVLVIADRGADEDWGALCYPPME